MGYALNEFCVSEITTFCMIFNARAWNRAYVLGVLYKESSTRSLFAKDDDLVAQLKI